MGKFPLQFTIVLLSEPCTARHRTPLFPPLCDRGRRHLSSFCPASLTYSMFTAAFFKSLYVYDYYIALYARMPELWES